MNSEQIDLLNLFISIYTLFVGKLSMDFPDRQGELIIIVQ